jgi:hypothetical protein
MMKRFIVLFFITLLAALPALPAHAEDDGPAILDKDVNRFGLNREPSIQTTPLDMKLIAVGTVADVPRENIIKFDDGTVYKLENIRVPVNYFPVVIAYLKKKLLGKKVGIYVNPSSLATKFDDVGNKLGQGVTEDGIWIEADLVSQGMAWVTSSLYERDLVLPLYKYEEQARRKKLGLWVDPRYDLKNSKTIQGTYGSFQVFQDVVKSVNITSTYIFINFGRDYEKDFTIAMQRDICKLFTDAPRGNLDPRYWIGHEIRIRGWVQKHDGPMIQLTHPQQVEYPQPIPGTIDEKN